MSIEVRKREKNRYSLKYYERKNCNRLQKLSYDEILAVNGTFLRRNVEACLRKRVYPLLLHNLDSQDLSHRFLGQFSGKIAIHCFASSLKNHYILDFCLDFHQFSILSSYHCKKIWFFNNSAKHTILCDSLFLCLRCLVLKRKKKKREKSILSWICCGFIVKNIYLSSNVLGTVWEVRLRVIFYTKMKGWLSSLPRIMFHIPLMA